MAMAQQRMQQNASILGSGTVGLADANARVASNGRGSLASDNQVHQGSQSRRAVGSHDGVNSQVKESERSSAVEGSGNDQPLQQSSSTISDGGQNALRRTATLGLVAFAASAFDAAKDIMEALRSKHTNLASELEGDQATLVSPAEDESSREVFGLIKKLNNAPVTKKKAKASTFFGTLLTGGNSNCSSKVLPFSHKQWL